MWCLWHHTPKLICAVLILLLVAPIVLRAQTEQASITGTVSDASGAAIPKATVTATSVRTQVSAVTETNDLGYYNIPYLPIGDYSVKAEKEGFKVGTVTGITLLVGQIATINVQLTVGTVKQEITITAAPVLLQQQSAELGTSVTTNTILQMPISGRDPYSLEKLSPGVLPGTGDQPVVNGGRDGTTQVLLDGADTRTSCCSGLSYDPPLESVQEFKLITSNYSAEYGRSGGGELAVVGKMGTDAFHFSAYEFVQNNILNANSLDLQLSGRAQGCSTLQPVRGHCRRAGLLPAHL